MNRSLCMYVPGALIRNIPIRLASIFIFLLLLLEVMVPVHHYILPLLQNSGCYCGYEYAEWYYSADDLFSTKEGRESSG